MRTILAVTRARTYHRIPQTPGTQLVDFQAEGFTRLLEADADKDGKLSKEEWTARSGGASRQNAAVGFRQLDANGNGQLTADERQAFR